MKRFLTILLLNAVALTSFAYSQEDFNPFAANKQKTGSTATLISEKSTIAPGEPFTVALKLEIPENKHAYYINPGLIGKSMDFQWDLPKGFKVSDIQWQTPHTATTFGMVTYGYSNTSYFPVTITPPADLELGKTITLKLKARWQVCDDTSCVDEPNAGDYGDYTVAIVTGDTSIVSTNVADYFKKIAKYTPQADSDWKFTASDDGKEIHINIAPPAGTELQQDHVYFFDENGQTDAQAKQNLIKDGDTYTLSIPRFFGNDFNPQSGPTLDELKGILSIKDGEQAFLVSSPFTEATSAPQELESASVSKLLGIMGGMLIGGLILNLMPCVFPVIGLKIMGFTQQAGEEKNKIVLHGLTFTAGVLISFWILSGILLSLRNTALAGAGEDVGWGYQLQDPYVVFALLLLMFIMGLNMFGVFEIGAKAVGVGSELQNKKGLAGSFFSGVLATVVATPCSAPFLGAAIGAAFGLPNFQFMIAFTAMAVGLAIPYLILSIFPQLIEKLPRPGPWMESFKQGMSFLLFATAGYLVWVYVGQIGLPTMLNLVIGLSAIAMGAWIYGRWNLPHKSSRTRWIAKALALILVVGGIVASLPPKKSSIEWETWSQETADQLIEEGKPVYIDYTAQWCLTCQVNKKRAYTEEVQALFKDYGVVALKADKTNPDPKIEAALKKLDRTAIPVNVLYIPGKDEPIITPEILSPAYLKELITENLEKP